MTAGILCTDHSRKVRPRFGDHHRPNPNEESAGCKVLRASAKLRDIEKEMLGRMGFGVSGGRNNFSHRSELP